MPNGFPEIHTPKRNPLSREGIDLGKMLFYDPMLSSNGRVSCASCHLQQLAFTDGQPLSQNGVSGKPGRRNTPTLTNLVFQEFFFWDGGAQNLESQSFAPLMHADEMDINLTALCKRLSEHPIYSQKFKLVFQKDSITSSQIVRALAQFQRTLISSNSHYDQVMKGDLEFTEGEARGLNIFQLHCKSCHPPPLFTDNDFHNNGLDSIFSSEHEGIGKGRYRITLNKKDMGKFKTPTLRNISKTSPYMHDGRFTSLHEVLKHYQSGIIPSETLDSLLMVNPLLSDSEIVELGAFLETLTDTEFLENPSYSSPF